MAVLRLCFVHSHNRAAKQVHEAFTVSLYASAFIWKVFLSESISMLHRTPYVRTESNVACTEVNGRRTVLYIIMIINIHFKAPLILGSCTSDIGCKYTTKPRQVQNHL